MAKKYASLDIGLKRIGVAICLMNNIVTPLEAILRKNRNQASSDTLKVLNEWEIDTLVVGYPASSPEMQRRIDHFLTLLNFTGEVIKQNEDMSSIEAEELLKGEIKHKRDGRIDSLAAKIILERFLAQ